ncbi:MAG: CBS domain-containing protein [Armatimonadota bacterium]
MDLIISHTNTDFDALASMVAASLLYPTAVMSLPGGADRNVREFLSLHSDVITLVPAQDIPLDRVKRLIIVETQHAHRLGRFAELIGRPGVQVILYDHHTPQQPTVQAMETSVEAYGANTTQMVGLLRRRDIAIDPLQATLFALGIYEDTGCLTFSATTPEDVEAVAWLLREGANLDLVASFINRTLTESQRAILNQLLTSAETRRVHGIQVLVATADAGGSADELALLAHKLRDIESSDAVMVLIQLDDSVLLVARSSVDAVNAGAIARLFGGGGHDRAASATIHHATVERVKTELDAMLEREVQPRVTAATLMSFPVRTITPQTTVEEAAKLMLRYGHGGLTVVDDAGKVVGMISRRDVDRARHHGLGHAPVRAYMSLNVTIITPQTTLPEIERLMIERDVGRLPVIEDSRLVGIVTRSDVLRAIHGERYASQHTLFRSAGPVRNIWGLFNERLPAANRDLLLRIADIATGLGVTIFLVGGAVRDLMLGNPNIDLDILVEGEGIPLAEAVGMQMGGRVVIHPKFHTGKVEFPDGRHVDFATARTEFYQYPAALPTAEHSSVREDLYRRDFTMNAMAMEMNGEEPGRLLDPFGGSRDLVEGLIRVLHNLSFVEDPTRILRAVRFETRFGFRMDQHTEELARHAVEMELLDRVSGERIRAEFIQLFARPFPETGLRRMDELGVLAALEPLWSFTGPAPEYARLEDALTWAANEPAVSSHLLEIAHQRLLLIFSRLPRAAAERLAERLRLRKRERILARQVPALSPLLPRLEDPSLSSSQLHELLGDLAEPLCLILMALSDSELAWERVKTELLHLRNLPALVTGEDIRRLGIPRGPHYTSIMHAVRQAQLDGKISTREDALAMIARMVGRE